jgi:drug/metabolite transporter (DMT)-like permease
MTPATDGRALLRAMPVVFVLIWSTGFVVARLGMPHAPPLTFLAWRFALSVLAFAVWIGISRAAWPQGATQWAHLGVTGVLMHAGYLGGVWAAVKGGLGAGAVALIVGLQPVLTALWQSTRKTSSGEQRIAPHQWLGLALGVVGLVLVLWHKLGAGEVTAHNVALTLVALLCITAGTLYQKRYVAPCDVRTANAIQLAAAWAVTAPLALAERGTMDLQPELWVALAWSVLVLSLGGSSLLYLLIQRGAATRVTSLMYLVPPCTALMAWLLFGEALGGLVLPGLLITAFGVSLVMREPAAR